MTFPTYRGNLTWLQERTILLTRHGSHAYGTNIATSDEDFKGVCVPPREYLHGFMHVFEQAEGKDPDLVVYDIRKFMRLAADCNPSIIEILWTSSEDWLHVEKFVGDALLDERATLLSTKCRHTFSGYAVSQLKRIKLHRRYLLDPPKAPPTRGEFGLPDRTLIPADQIAAANAAVEKKLAEWEPHFVEGDEAAKIATKNKMAAVLAEIVTNSEDTWSAAARSIGMDDNLIRVMQKEREYAARSREWQKYREWKENRNEARAGLEAKHGYDTKHGMHLVRLMRMCREILERGEVVVKRPDREELLAIRAGAWTYEQIVEWAEKEDAALDDVAKASKLPHHPDRKKLDALCQRIVESMI